MKGWVCIVTGVILEVEKDKHPSRRRDVKGVLRCFSVRATLTEAEQAG